MKYFLAALLFLFSVGVTHAQGVTNSGDFFRSELKFYVVAGVLSIIFVVLFIFLFNLEKRIKQLEKKSN